MRVSVLATNHGPHPADKWAFATAQHVFPIDPSVVGDRLLAAQRTQLAIADALVQHHTNVQDAERQHLTEKGDARLAEPLDATDHANAAFEALKVAVSGSPWAEHFAKPEVQAAALDTIHQHFRTSQDIERSWHVTRKGA